MKTQFGEMISGEFGEDANTMMFEIEGEMTLKAGKYAIVPIEEYEDKYRDTTKKCGFCVKNEHDEKPKLREAAVFDGFWKRLEMFVEDVSVNDPMSEEEKDMILNTCRKQLK